MLQLTKQSIQKRIGETKEIIEWLEKCWGKYKVTPKDISTKNLIVMRRKTRKSKLAVLVNDYLEVISKETQFELEMILYMLEGCIDDYQSYSETDGKIPKYDDLRTSLPNLIVNKFPELWKKLKKSNESTAIESNLKIINELSTSGKLKEEEFFKDFDSKDSKARSKRLKGDLEKIKHYVKEVSVEKRKTI